MAGWRRAPSRLLFLPREEGVIETSALSFSNILSGLRRKKQRMDALRWQRLGWRQGALAGWRHKSFIIQGFDDFCGVLNADLCLPL
jgi:hypothetical protein